MIGITGFVARATCAALLLTLCVSGAGDTPAARVALVIGNDRYDSAPLNNSVNDARAMGESLAHLGFDVVEIDNATRAQIISGIDTVRKRLQGGRSVAMLYYAGHGVQLDWRNYIIPVDAHLTRAADAESQAVPVDLILQDFAKARSTTNIVVLDACRDNPFSQGATGKGLAQMDAPADTLLAYATAPGNVAADGASAHGVYTDALLRELGRPGVKIEDMFKRVRLQVRLDSQGRQIPWESTSLESDFYFNPPAGGAAQSQSDEQKHLEVELSEWHRAESTNTVSSWASYLDKFPSGYFASAAQFHLDHVQTPQATVQPSPRSSNALPADALPPGTNRYRKGDVFVWQNTDVYTGRSHNSRRTITEADDAGAEFDDGTRVDQIGNILSDAESTYDPMVNRIPPVLEVGRKWRTVFRKVWRSGGQAQNFGDSDYRYLDNVIIAREPLKIPAGTFDTFRIETRGFGSGVSISREYWIDARTMLVIKIINKVVVGSHKGSAGPNTIQELVSGPRLGDGGA